MSEIREPNAVGEMLNSEDQEHQLRQAAFHGSLDLVKSLLTKDNINAGDAIGRTPLALACWGGHFEVAEHLLTAGADIAGHFRHATTLKHAKIVELLLRFGADVNEQYPDGQRPLHHACERENIDVAKVLLKYRADVNVNDCFGKTPLHYASSRGNQPLTKLLLENHSDINSADLNLKTPLHSASRYLPVVRTLLENRANVSPYDAHGCTPINASSLDIDVFTLLLDYGCGANVLCRRPKCLCNRTVLMCRYFELQGQENLMLDCLERYFIKAQEAGILNEKNTPADSEWRSVQRGGFRAKCAAELARMKSEFTGGSTVDYHSILNLDLFAMRNQPFFNLTPESCRQEFPIYGDMVYCHFLKVKRLLLLEQCSILFSLTDLPWLPLECVSHLLNYLPDEDLWNASTLCRQLNLKSPNNIRGNKP